MPPHISELDLDTSVPRRFEQTVEQYPDRLAVRSARHAWSYSELNRLANRIAHAVQSVAGPQTAPVALLFAHDAPAVASIFGVLKAGKFYAALEPSFPLAHNRSVVDDLRTPLLLCDRANLAEALELAGPGCAVLVYEDIDDTYSVDNPGIDVPSTATFAIFYTSGSTGRPKGVQRNHALAMHRFVMDTWEAGIVPSDRQALVTSFTYAGTSSDTHRALLNGASLHLYDFRTFGTTYLAEWLRQEEITYLRPPIALFRHLLASLGEGDAFPSMRVISLGGAALFRHDVEKTRSHFPTCALIHRYSTSESGEVARHMISADTPIGSPIVHVGPPLEGKEVSILDENRNELPRGEAGEIAVRSRYLVAGYWAQAEASQQHYMLDAADSRNVTLLTGDLGRIRADGCLELLGRSDSLVKIRGYRVELAAVEAALREIDGVDNATVLALPDSAGEMSIVAYVVSEACADAAALRRELAATLPEYMWPSLFLFLDALPLTHSGKVDLKALPAPRRHLPIGRKWLPPRDSTQTALVEIWSEVLGVDGIGVTDNFFELGGHSLLAARVIALTNQKFGTDLLLRALYDAPTVEQLATHMKTGGPHGAEAKTCSNEARAVKETRRLLGL